MTTTDFGATPPAPPPPPPPPGPRPHVLRRSRTDRVGAGVAGGLGEYFGLDPVLFRVLFAVAAFFGGAGILAYVLAWAAIPEEGTQRAAVDGWVAELRRRKVPLWTVAIVAGLLLWVVSFSWWAPGPFFPVLVVVVVLVVLFGRRGGTDRPPAAPPVSLSKDGPATAPTLDPGTAAEGHGAPTVGPGAQHPPTVGATAGGADWVASARSWILESQQASRERRRRAFPVRIATVLALVLTLIGLGIADAAAGIALPLYFWCTGAIVTAGLLTGLALRRTPWSMAPLLVPVVAGMVAFGNTGASLHDGVGQRDWVPTSTAQLQSHYRLAFGQGTLDLRSLPVAGAPRRVEVTMAAGQARVLLPTGRDITVVGNVRIGEIDVNGRTVADTHGGSIYRTGGYDIQHTVAPPEGATGAAITVVVHLADGQLTVRHPS
jgi:phage shock protein PspC (stress-responsive transcriptional regulator)